MNIVFINASPKGKNSNSCYFLELLQNSLTKDSSNDITIKQYTITSPYSEADFYTDIANSQAIVFAFPLYVDSLPSNVLSFLRKMEEVLKSSPCSATIYAIVNCGFYEGKQNELGIEILKNWCSRVSLPFGQAIGIGSGEMLGSLRTMPLEEGPNKNLGIAIQKFSHTIVQQTTGETIYVIPSYFPRFFFIKAANHFWVKRAKKNNLKKRDLYRKFAVPKKEK